MQIWRRNANDTVPCGDKAKTSTEDQLLNRMSTATEDTGSGTSEGNEGSDRRAGTNQVWTDTLSKLTSSGGWRCMYAKPEDTLTLHLWMVWRGNYQSMWCRVHLHDRYCGCYSAIVNNKGVFERMVVQ